MWLKYYKLNWLYFTTTIKSLCTITEELRSPKYKTFYNLPWCSPLPKPTKFSWSLKFLYFLPDINSIHFNRVHKSQTHFIHRSFSRFLRGIENLTLALCKRQKWKEQVKVCKCRKFGDLILKTVALVKFLKTENLTENVSEFCVGRACHALQASIPWKLPIHYLLEFRGTFCFQKPHQCHSFQY